MKHRKKNRSSIRIRIAALFTASLFVVVLLVWIMNNLFLGRFYLSYKCKVMENTFNDINSAAESGDLYDDNYYYRIEKLCANENLSLMVISADGTVIMTSLNENNAMLKQLFDVMLDNDSDSVVMVANDDYSIARKTDEQTDNEFLTLWGTLSDGNLILLRSAIQSMRDAAAVSNRFLLYIGIASVIMAMLPAYFVSRYIARLENDIRVRDENEKMRREFISNVSHELKTPLALIKGYAEGLLCGILEDEESRNYYLDVIVDETDKMSRMVTSLLSLNKLEYGRLEVSRKEFDLSELARSVVSVHRIMIEEKNIKVVFAMPGSCYVNADPMLSEQIVDNYLSNALHYVKDDLRIEIRIEEEDNKARLVVFNTGDPIPESSVERIWEKFYKVDEARTREYGGSGIGLSIVKAAALGMECECGIINYDNGVAFWFDFNK